VVAESATSVGFVRGSNLVVKQKESSLEERLAENEHEYIFGIGYPEPNMYESAFCCGLVDRHATDVLSTRPIKPWPNWTWTWASTLSIPHDGRREVSLKPTTAGSTRPTLATKRGARNELHLSSSSSACTGSRSASRTW